MDTIKSNKLSPFVTGAIGGTQANLKRARIYLRQYIPPDNAEHDKGKTQGGYCVETYPEFLSQHHVIHQRQETQPEFIKTGEFMIFADFHRMLDSQFLLLPCIAFVFQSEAVLVALILVLVLHQPVGHNWYKRLRQHI